MKKQILTAALMLLPAVAAAEHPEGGPINDIKSEIRDDYRQLNEDRAAGFTDALVDDQKQIDVDKARLRDAMRHPHDAPPPPPPPHHIIGADDREPTMAPPPPRPEDDQLRNGMNHGDKLDPDVPFNHAAHVDDEMR